MHCTLLVPDLLWPGEAAAEASRGLDAGALETALSRAHAARHDALPVEGWLCQAFEVERQQDWPVAPLTLALDGGAPAPDEYWLRADPVHLQLHRDRVALMAGDTLRVSQAEADAAVAALNTQFAGDGLHFIAGSPARWYLRASRKPALVTQTLGAAAGRNVRDVLPTGEDAAPWRQVFNEIQMLLHGLPLNEARGAAGLPEINSVWFWGGGVRTRVPGRAFGAVWSDDALAQGLGTLADAHAAALPADAAAWLRAAAAHPSVPRHLVVVESCARAAAYGDVNAWREAVAALDRAWVAPLLAGLRARTLSGLTIAAPGGDASWRFDLGPRSLYKLWVRPRPLSAWSA